MKLVLDTNIFISALLWHGLPHQLLKLIEKEIFVLCITPSLLEELRDVLSRPEFFLFIKERKTTCEELVVAILDIAELHPDKKIDPVIKSDPDDDKVLSCALTSEAEYIITGDPHLLKLKKWSNISIMTPRQFLNHIK